MKIAIHGKKLSSETIPFVQQIINILQKEKSVIGITSLLSECLDKIKIDKTGLEIVDEQSIQNYDAILSLGGDGTFLETVTYVKNLGVPILGINMGKLGFLANIEKTKIQEALELFFKKKYTRDKRTLLHIETDKKGIPDIHFALNEFTINKKDSASLIKISCYINNTLLTKYWADGLIISTPTGSTAYSLSCGGPFVFPKTECFIITPISPHQLTIRPIIVPDSSEITLEVDTRDQKKNIIISLDSRWSVTHADTKITIKKSTFTVDIIQLENSLYIDTLRNKLNWGLDYRN
ncbi:MAG: NAD kinase [Chitinophagaceae bacterium]|nr:NAD kinase [Chitinophagaceae bacterium]